SAAADLARLSIAGRQFHTCIEVDDVLSPRRGMPLTVMLRLGLPEYDAKGKLTSRCLALRPLVFPLDSDVAPMRFALSIAVQIMNPDPHWLRVLFIPPVR